jgi:hypothetical protein
MKTNNYLRLCAVITVVLVVSLLYIPAVSNTVEGVVLLYLSTSA